MVYPRIANRADIGTTAPSIQHIQPVTTPLNVTHANKRVNNVDVTISKVLQGDL